MKNVLNKITMFFLSVSVIATSSITAYAQSSTQTNEREKLIQEFLLDDDFNSIYNSIYKEEMEKVIDDILSRRNAPTPRTAMGSYAYCTTPVIKQATSYYCGFASMQQVLTALSLDNYISGQTDLQKQTTLRNQQNAILAEQGIGASSTGVVAYMSLVLNMHYINKLSSGKYYQWYNIIVNEGDANKDFYIDDFKEYTYNSLMFNRPTIMYTNTSKLSYYNGTNYTHYIVADYINLATSQIETADCCWTDAYRGHFMVPIQEAYNAVYGNYLICLSQ